MTSPKRYEPILDYCLRTGLSERSLRGWLVKGQIPYIVEQVPGKVGRPRILVDVEAVGNYRVLYARPTSFRQMLKAASNQGTK